MIEILIILIPNLKVELIAPVLCKGYPREDTLAAFDKLAEGIAVKLKEAGLIAG